MKKSGYYFFSPDHLLFRADTLPGDRNVALLDVEVRLTTMTRRSLRAEMDLVSKSNNFTGPRMNISLQNRNAFGGAELLNGDPATVLGSVYSQLARVGVDGRGYLKIGEQDKLAMWRCRCGNRGWSRGVAG